jgi:hypothetical protein
LVLPDLRLCLEVGFGWAILSESRIVWLWPPILPIVEAGVPPTYTLA